MAGIKDGHVIFFRKSVNGCEERGEIFVAVDVFLEAGLMEMHEGENEVVLEAPAGIIKTVATVKNGKVTGVTLTNVPAFVYKENCELEYEGKKVVFDICFGGSFFALVDTEKNLELLVDFLESEAGPLNQEVLILNISINSEVLLCIYESKE